MELLESRGVGARKLIVFEFRVLSSELPGVATNTITTLQNRER
jgi:hypothetical protein